MVWCWRCWDLLFIDDFGHEHLPAEAITSVKSKQPLPERPAFVADVAGKNRHGYAGCMGYFRHVQSDTQRWQQVMRQSHANAPGLRYGNQIYQDKEQRRTVYRLSALSEYKKFG